jgi:hypothetical protein
MYIDLEYIRKRVKESDLADLSTDSDEPNELNQGRIEALIADAGAMLDRALKAAGYSAPIASPGDDIKRTVFDVFLYYLYARKYDDEEMKDVYVRYNKAFDYINGIANKSIFLPDGTRVLDTLQNCIVTNKLSTDRIFTSASLDA